ncbi:hypothetical protein [Agrobacterium sp. 22-226-1]
MPRYVIDTNVPVVANGASANVNIDCRMAAVELLQSAIEKGVIFLDSAGDIQEEYRRYLDPKGQPGVGDRFYLEILNSHPGRIARVDVPKGTDGQYVDLPKPIIDSGFDPSDRKFAAVAAKAKARVFNAVDTDWIEQRAVIEENGIPITFLCGIVPENWNDTTDS